MVALSNMVLFILLVSGIKVCSAAQSIKIPLTVKKSKIAEHRWRDTTATDQL